MSMRPPMSKAVPKERDDAAWAVAMRRQQFGYAEISAEGGSAMALATRIVKGWVAEGRARAITEKIGSSRILFEVVPEEELRLIVSRPDSIRRAEDRPGQAPVVEYTKIIDGDRHVILFEVLTRRRRLSLLTMWVENAGTSPTITP